MLDLEDDYKLGLELIADWRQVSVAEIIGRVAMHNPREDLGVAVRWYVWDWFVNKRYCDRTMPKHYTRRLRRHQEFFAGTYRTKHVVRLPGPTR
jgi:hypothetical protein